MSAAPAPEEPGSRFGIVATTAVEVTVSTGLWFAVGRLLDLLAGTGPWFTFAGACVGCWVGLYLAWSGGHRREQDAPDADPPADEPESEEDRSDATPSTGS